MAFINARRGFQMSVGARAPTGQHMAADGEGNTSTKTTKLLIHSFCHIADGFGFASFNGLELHREKKKQDASKSKEWNEKVILFFFAFIYIILFIINSFFSLVDSLGFALAFLFQLATHAEAGIRAEKDNRGTDALQKETVDQAHREKKATA
jgi:hypothetical protein